MWRFHVLLLEHDVEMAPFALRAAKFKISFPSKKLKATRILVLADLDVLEQRVDKWSDEAHHGASPSLADNYMNGAGVEIVRTDIQYTRRTAPVVESAFTDLDVPASMPPPFLAKRAVSDFGIVDSPNEVTCEYMDNRRPFPYPDAWFAAVVMRRGLCTCPGTEDDGGCAGVSTNVDVATTFLIECLRVTSRERGCAVYLHGVRYFVDEEYWTTAGMRTMQYFQERGQQVSVMLAWEGIPVGLKLMHLSG